MRELALFIRPDRKLTKAGSASLEEIKKRRELDRYERSSSEQVREMKFLFDATSSMSSMWQEARNGIERVTDRTTQLIPNIAVSITAYRDYCDCQGMIEQLPSTRDIGVIKSFIGGIRCYGGGDTPEAVEVALELLLTDSSSFAVLVGDAPPHGVMDDVVSNKDWRDISQQLARQQKKVYTVLVGNLQETESVFREIATITGGRYFRLEQIDELVDILSATAAKHVGKLSSLAALIKKEQGGKLTGRQIQILQE